MDIHKAPAATFFNFEEVLSDASKEIFDTLGFDKFFHFIFSKDDFGAKFVDTLVSEYYVMQ